MKSEREKRTIERWAVVYQEINIQKATYIWPHHFSIEVLVCGVLCSLRRNEINIYSWFTFDIYMLSIEDKMYFIFIFIFICLWLSFIYWMFSIELAQYVLGQFNSTSARSMLVLWLFLASFCYYYCFLSGGLKLL